MNSHDKGLAYALAPVDERQRRQNRANWSADIADAMENGFKAEPDLAPHHLPLLSDEALERVFKESEKWRDKAHERALEQTILDKQDECNELNDRYVVLREIIGAMFVPDGYHRDDSDRYFRWTEQTARELVAKADASDRNRQAAEDAEQRVNLLERYVKACDENRLPYNWNVFKMPTRGLHQHVIEHENHQKLGRLTTSSQEEAMFSARIQQETEQALREHAQRIEATRQYICKAAGFSRIGPEVGEKILDVLLGRNNWIAWEWAYKPRSLDDADTVEIQMKGGKRNTLEAGVIDWSLVQRYRPVK